jgi:hypothetical protein
MFINQAKLARIGEKDNPGLYGLLNWVDEMELRGKKRKRRKRGHYLLKWFIVKASFNGNHNA